MKRLIVCCDGTWNAADSANAETNVFRLAKSIHATHGQTGTQQIVLYLRGVGTTGLKLGDVVEGATGLGIGELIRSAYMFLAQNYETGDELFLFGFSRGAFTARSLVGFVHVAGLLRRQNLDLIHNAWALYRNRGVATPDIPAIASAAVHEDVEVKFLGVWDTVGSLGVPNELFIGLDTRLFGFHSTDVSPIVRRGCHALAIDEHRGAFVPTLWTGALPAGTRIDQTWFAGVHSDVGGGYRSRRLADIPLGWMAKHAEAESLEIDGACLPMLAGPLDPLAPTHESRTLLFEADKLRPTWRQVCQRAFDVHPFEKLFAPMDENRTPLRTINEKIHASVAARFGKIALECTDDKDGTTKSASYAPKNLAPSLAAQAGPGLGVSIDSFAWPSATIAGSAPGGPPVYQQTR